jgi:hypothetical protein
MAISDASARAKERGCIMYVVEEPSLYHVTPIYPEDRKKLLAKCWPGGRKELKFVPQNA